MSGMPTLADVAREAGVSASTASRILNGSARRVGDARRPEVLAAARRLGYIPNAAAQAVARGTTSIVHLLLPDVLDPYFTEFADAFTRAAAMQRLTVALTLTGRSAAEEAQVLEQVRSSRPRGVVFVGGVSRETNEWRHIVAGLQAGGTRVVAVGARLPGARTLPVSNEDGARRLGRMLRQEGYDHAVVLASEREMLALGRRAAGFEHGFQEAGGGRLAVMETSTGRIGGRHATQVLMDRGLTSGTLLFGVTDAIAAGAADALRAAGRVVGHDIAVAGFGGTDTALDVAPGLTTVRIPLEQLGQEAVHAVLDPAWEPRKPVDPEPILRASTPIRHHTAAAEER
jgi:LacI family transcriptional regulator